MKFAEHLGAHITPEWRKQYIDYEKMKSMLYEAQEAAPTDEDTDPESVKRYYAKFHEQFFCFCDRELKKINIFFSEKLAESMRKLATLKSDLEQLKTKSLEQLSDKKKPIQKVAFTTKTQHDLKLAFSEFYLSLILIQSYQTLNFTGFRKILKKHDKLFETRTGAEWRQSQVETSLFYTSKEVSALIEQVENLVTGELEGGDRGKAMKRLRVPPRGEKQNPITTFLVGLFLGSFIIMLTVSIFTCMGLPQYYSYQLVVRLYRGPLLVILFIFMIGFNTYGWRRSGVNHVLIFELDPRNHFTDLQYLEAGALMACFWGVSFILFTCSLYFKMPPLVHPLWMWLFLICYLLNPLPVCHHHARRWLMRILLKCITPGLHFVTFAQFWLADQLNSLVLLLLDFVYTVCFYTREVQVSGDGALLVLKAEALCVNGTVASCYWQEGKYIDTCMNGTYRECAPVNICMTSKGYIGIIRALIALAPAMIRFIQCWRRYYNTRHAYPHLVNAGKYSTTFFVVVFSYLHTEYKEIHAGLVSNPFFWLWVIAAIVSSCYTYTWDVKMDWGLFDKNAGENKLLREQIVYRYKGYYYFALIEDFILRFLWIFTMTVSETGQLLDSEIVRSVSGLLEIFRRIIWNFFRLENEHLNNCGEFRAVRDISVTPIDHSDQALLEKMMDEDDGVTNRKDKQSTKKRTLLKRITSKSILEDDEEETNTDTWTAFKGGISNWLNSKRTSSISDGKPSVSKKSKGGV